MSYLHSTAPRTRGDGNTEVHEGLEGHRALVTHQTHHGAAKLSLEEVDDDRVVPLLVVLPGHLRSDGVVNAVVVLLLNVALLSNLREESVITSENLCRVFSWLASRER